MMQCPKCGNKLKIVEFDDENEGVCDKCHAYWRIKNGQFVTSSWTCQDNLNTTTSGRRDPNKSLD